MKWCGMIALLAVLLFAVAGCEDTTNLTTEAPNNGHNGRVIGMVHGIVTAQGTNEPVADVRITYSLNGDTRSIQSDANGDYRIDGLDEGVYTICFFPPDTTFAAWYEQVTVEYDSALVHPNDRDFHITISRNVVLYRCTTTLTGYVFARTDEEHTIPAAGAVVQMSNMGGILNATYSTVCDNDGRYWLPGLPAVGVCMVVALPWSSGSTSYGSGSQTVVLTQNGIIAANTVTLTPVTTPVTVLNNNFLAGDFPVGDNLVLVFNRPLKDSSVVVNLYSSSGFVPTTEVLDAAGVTLTIDPAVQLRPSTSYNVTVNGRTLDNQFFNYGPVGFSTEPRLELVATNLWQVDGAIRQDVGLNETLYFRFSRAVNVNDPHNTVHVLRGGSDILVDWGWSEDHLQLNVTPVGSFLPNTMYTAFFVACSPIFGDQVAQSIDFQTMPDTQPPTQVTNVALDDTAHFNWMTNAIWLSWDTQPRAESYSVFAWDEQHATDYINVGTYPRGDLWAAAGASGAAVDLRLGRRRRYSNAVCREQPGPSGGPGRQQRGNGPAFDGCCRA